VRVSGPAARGIARAVLGDCPAPRRASLRSFRDGVGETIDTGIALFFPAPTSFTGEDVLELQGHGGPVVNDLLLESVLAAGARLARPGEFSERAFLNGRIDLAQAEAVADLIDSSTAQAARSAQRSLQGALSARVRQAAETLGELRVRVEATLDFPEDEVSPSSEVELRAGLTAVRATLEDLLRGARFGCLLREGLHLVLAGVPNVGKSSLLNALSGRDSAIVTEVPGTTRDLLREGFELDGVPVHVVDTAGLRAPTDPVETIGVAKAWEAIRGADLVLLVLDARDGVRPEEEDILRRLPPQLPRLLVCNKIDLTGEPPTVADRPEGRAVFLSAKTRVGLSLLADEVKRLAGYTDSHGTFTARRRHLEGLAEAAQWVDQAGDELADGRTPELLAECLRRGQQSLGAITGEVTTDELLSRIFSTFCIGK
jgi:tRNA modification GTPase